VFGELKSEENQVVGDFGGLRKILRSFWRFVNFGRSMWVFALEESDLCMLSVSKSMFKVG